MTKKKRWQASIISLIIQFYMLELGPDNFYPIQGMELVLSPDRIIPTWRMGFDCKSEGKRDQPF